MIKFVYILTTCFLCGVAAQAQKNVLSNLRQKKIPVSQQLVQIDTLSMVPQSFFIDGQAPQNYILNELNATLFWRQIPATDSVVVHYRVFPFKMQTATRRYLYDSIANKFVVSPFAFKKNGAAIAETRLLNFGNLTYSGSLGRSLSFGNSQDAVVNSSFNLQLNGLLADSIEITAAITDNNIPIQPDGTTQQLNEFDRIFLQFKKKPWELSLGDIDLRQTNFTYLNFYKRLQGISFNTQNNLGPYLANKFSVTGAIAKGKFTRNIFNGIEGNQGPYRLKGANNELFFVVLANTERVFIDGVLMQRGEDQDYVINYNTAEITFTPKQFITKDKRLQIEFEYADRNYVNYLLYATNEMLLGKKWKIAIGAYSNSDAKNSPINQTLDNPQKQFLSQLGDSIQNALYPAVYADTFGINKILYLKKDTIVNSISYPIYQYTTSNLPSLFTLSFADIGLGKGNYIPLFNASNGKVYAWVAPQNGVPQGQYEPVQTIVTPKRQIVGTLKVEYAFNNTTQATIEAGFSKYDVNSFSSKDKKNDNGAAAKITVSDNRPFFFTQKKLNLFSTAGYEYVHKNFKPLERLRSVEFLRDWGLPADFVSVVAEQLPTIGFAINDEKQNSIAFNYKGYLRGDGYEAHRQTISHHQLFKGWQLRDEVFYTAINSPGFSGYLLRPFIGIDKTFAKLAKANIGASFALDHNQLRSKISNNLMLNNYSFYDWDAFIKSDALKPNRWSFTYHSRVNRLPIAKQFLQADASHSFAGFVELLKNANQQFRLNATYRILKITNSTITTLRPENNLLGRAEYVANVLHGFVTANVLYEIGSGQEQRRDFSYVEVPAGKGEFTWNDYNADGIQQLNEFETALFQDQAKFIRIFTPTNQFIKAAYNTFNYAFTISPRSLFTKNALSKFQKTLSKLQWQSALQTSKKAISNSNFQLNPFGKNLADTSLIALNTAITNTISYNRASTLWGVDFNQNFNTSRSILTYGLETRTYKDVSVKLRYNPSKLITLELLQRSNQLQLSVPNPKFDNRNYSISTYTAEPKITYTGGSTFRASGSYRADIKKANSSAANQPATIQSLAVESKYNVLQNASLQGKITYSQIKFSGLTNTTTAFILLDGLQPGKNILWTASFTKRLANSLEINFEYEGRSPGIGRTIHVGRASLRALL